MRKSTLLALAVLALFAGWHLLAWAACTNTTNLGLCKPSFRDADWLTRLNANFDILDAPPKLVVTGAGPHAIGGVAVANDVIRFYQGNDGKIFIPATSSAVGLRITLNDTKASPQVTGFRYQRGGVDKWDLDMDTTGAWFLDDLSVAPSKAAIIAQPGQINVGILIGGTADSHIAIQRHLTFRDVSSGADIYKLYVDDTNDRLAFRDMAGGADRFHMTQGGHFMILSGQIQYQLGAQGNIGTVDNFGLGFFTNNAAKMRLEASGNLVMLVGDLLFTAGALKQIGTTDNFDLSLLTNNSQRWKITNAGHFLAVTDNTYDIGANGATRPRDIHLARWIQQAEVTSDPGTGDLSTDAEVATYNKNDKFVIAYNNAGTVTYITIPLDGTTTTWTHSTIAP